MAHKLHAVMLSLGLRLCHDLGEFAIGCVFLADNLLLQAPSIQGISSTQIICACALWDCASRNPATRREVPTENYLLDPKTRRLIVWYPNGRAYMLSLEWLERSRRGGSSLTSDELAELARQYPLATGLFDEHDLASYVD